jgi:prepilin-type N-terminal cleavage/methylation domain-containing protein
MRHYPRRAAFTLLEVVLTLAVIVILAALTYPSLEAMYGQSRVTAGADSLKGAMLSARAQAVEEGVAYRVGIVPGKGNIRIAPDQQSYWDGTSAAPAGQGQTSIIVEKTMPKSVIFSDTGTPLQPNDDSGKNQDSSVSTGEYKTAAVFLPDGTARDDYKVLVCSRSCTPLWVILRSLTGEVSVTRYQTDGGQ